MLLVIAHSTYLERCYFLNLSGTSCTHSLVPVVLYYGKSFQMAAAVAVACSYFKVVVFEEHFVHTSVVLLLLPLFRVFRDEFLNVG